MMIRLLLTMLLLLPALPVRAAGVEEMFGKGHVQFSLMAGNAHAVGKGYFIIGGSASYYVADGLAAGLTLETWSTDGPTITKYAPFVQYVFYRGLKVPLYVGASYRHASIEGLPGINSVGMRAGVLLAAGPVSFFSFGVVHESYINCQESIYQSCSETYPDINLIVAF